MKKEEFDEKLTTEEAAEYLTLYHKNPVKKSTLVKYRQTGGGPKFRKNNQRRSPISYNRDDIDAWMDSHTYSSLAEQSEKLKGNI